MSIADNLTDYREKIITAWSSVDDEAVCHAKDILEQALLNRTTVFVCGNGGSAAIANHLCCDMTKGIYKNTGIGLNIRSLAHLELVTAIANDVAFEEVFAYQLEMMADSNDTLITISASGDSENIVRALTWANSINMKTIAMTGEAKSTYPGGRSATMADVNLHVVSNNYGVIEDVHQGLMHYLAQSISNHF